MPSRRHARPLGLALASLALGSLAWSGCGARSTLSLGDDAGPPVVADSGPPDAGTDAGTPRVDAGPREACRRDADCARSVCRARPDLTPRDLAPLPLSCGSDAGGRAVGESCRSRGECGRGLCAVAGVCLAPCATAADCAPNERCQEVYVQTAPQAMQPFSACATVVAAPDSVRVVGPDEGPALNGLSLMNPVTDTLGALPPNSSVVWIAAPGSVPILTQIRSRTSPFETLYTVFDGAGPSAPAPSWAIAPAAIGDMVTLLFPNGPGSPSAPDGLQLDLSSEVRTGTQRFVLSRDGGGAFFDIDAYLVGGMRWTSPDGSIPPGLRRALDDAEVLFNQAGLRVGEVRVHEIVGQLRSQFALLEGEEGLLGAPPELDDLYRMSAGANRPSVNVFFVREMDSALGIASGIPGPHAFHGTGASGVAISTDLLFADQIGAVLAHEVGHFMGLFHTSEADGSVNDPFPDTEECRADRDLDRDGFLVPDECAGAGADLVMFWAGGAGRFSPQQGALMRNAHFAQP